MPRCCRLLCIASAAWAHATLVSSEPADGSVLAQPPKMVQLHFNESVAPAVVGVIDAAGKARDVATRAVGQSVLIVLPDDLPQGTQIVSYRVVSQDGHPVAGSMVFSIGAVTGSRAASEGKSAGQCLIWLARIGVYLGLFVGVGGAFFAAWIGQGAGGSTVSRGALAVGLVSAVASLGLQGLDLLGLAARRHRDVGALDERAWHQPRAVAVDRDRGDGRSPGTRGKARASGSPGC